jgi:nickel-dependent lactate racemase
MVRLDFKIDFVLNEKNQVVKVYCGDVFAEHKKAAAESMDMYTFRVPKLSDVTVVSAYPLEQHIPQTSKGLNAASHVTKAGGHIIFTATNEEPEKFLALVDVVSSMPSALQYHRDLLEGHYNPPCPPYGLDFHVVCHLYKAILEKFSRIIYITDGLNKNQVEGMGFTYAPSMEEALSLVNSEVSNPDVTVFPAGGITLPILEHCS